MERWKTNLYTLWFSQVLSIMSFNFGIPFIPFYLKDLGIADANSVKIYSAILSSAPAITMAVMSPIWGIAADKWGKKLMLLRAMLFASLIIAGMGLVANANQLVLLRLFQGIFTGTIAASSALVAAGTPTNRLSFALGFLSSSTFIGASAGPVIGGFLAEHAGYRVSFYLGGALMMLGFLIVLFLAKEDVQIPDMAEALPETGKTAAKGSILSIFTGFMIIMLFLLLVLRISRSLFSPYLPLFVEENIKRNAASTTGIINGVTGIMTALSGLTISRLGDKYDKTSLIKLLLGLGILAAIPLGFTSNLWIFTIIYGLVFFIVGGVEPVVVSITTERTPPEKRGVLFGIQGLVGSIGWILAPVAAGYVSIRFSIQSVLFLVPLSLIPALAALFIFKKKLLNN